MCFLVRQSPSLLSKTTKYVWQQDVDLEYDEPAVSVRLTVNSRPTSASSAVVSVSARPTYQVPCKLLAMPTLDLEP